MFHIVSVEALPLALTLINKCAFWKITDLTSVNWITICAFSLRWNYPFKRWQNGRACLIIKGMSLNVNDAKYLVMSNAV